MDYDLRVFLQPSLQVARRQEVLLSGIFPVQCELGAVIEMVLREPGSTVAFSVAVVFLGVLVPEVALVLH